VRRQKYVAVPIHQRKVPMIVRRAFTGALRFRSFENVVGFVFVLRYDHVRAVLGETLGNLSRRVYSTLAIDRRWLFCWLSLVAATVNRQEYVSVSGSSNSRGSVSNTLVQPPRYPARLLAEGRQFLA
jgi:hypothetical protein